MLQLTRETRGMVRCIEPEITETFEVVDFPDQTTS